jgi:hypothetical protein
MNTRHAAVEEQLSLRVQATGRVIANFALQHLKAAVTFRDHVIAIESRNAGQPFGPFFEDVRSYASACIMSAAASLEALINEFFIAPNGALRSMLKDFESDFWGHGGIEWKSVLEKYQVALEMLGKPQFDKGVAPFHEAWALVELRNALVHYKPTWDPDRNRKIELVEVLSGKYELSPFLDAGADFITMKSMSSGCSRWVITTTLTFMKKFHARTNLDEHKMSAFWKLGT